MITINDLTVWYKYTATMTFVKRPYTHFKESILEKASRFVNGKAEIHVVPIYFYETDVYYQPIFDFDKCNDKYEVLAFINNELKTGQVKEKDIFIELSPHGIHVGLKYAFGPLSLSHIKQIREYARKIFSKYKHLDVISSIRLMAISRTPSFLKGKRMFAFSVSTFKKESIRSLRSLQEQLRFITFKFFRDQVNKYLFLQGLKDIYDAPLFVQQAVGV